MVGVVSLAACAAQPTAPAPNAMPGDNVIAAVQRQLAPLAGAAKAAGQTKVTVYGALVGNLQPVWNEFMREYPSITVSPVVLSGAALQSAVQQERNAGKPVGDLLITGEQNALGLGDPATIFEPFNPLGSDQVVPTAKDRSLAKYCTAPVALPLGLAYNTQKVHKSELPATWADLVDPKWKGKIAVNDPAMETSMSGLIAILKRAGVIDDTWMKKLAELHPIVVSGEAQIATTVGTGGADLGLTLWPALTNVTQPGSPVGFDFPIGGIGIVTNQTGCVLSDAPDKAAAHLLLSWLFSAPAQAAIANAGFYANVRGMRPISGLPAIEDIPKVLKMPAADAHVEFATVTKQLAGYFGR